MEYLTGLYTLGTLDRGRPHRHQRGEERHEHEPDDNDHGDRHPELFEINRIFNESARDLASHFQKEENVLFPFIESLVKAQQSGEPLGEIHFGTVENPIAMMMHEHSVEGDRFEEIVKLTNGYTPPADACNTYKVTFAMLQEFENDLNRHIHLENNILFPKAIALEKQLRS